jgi:hypothetical protein
MPFWQASETPSTPMQNEVSVAETTVKLAEN